jgi:hypothetical protein
VQFHKLAAIRAYVAGRPWAWIDDGIDDLGLVPDPPDGLAITDIADLNQTLRRNINSARGYQPPIELTAERRHATQPR